MAARQIERDNKRRVREEKQQREEDEEMEVFEAANLVYLRYKDGGKLGVDELKSIVHFIMLVDKRNKEIISKYNTKAKLQARLDDVQPSWEFFFDPRGSLENEDESDNKSDEDESDGANANSTTENVV